MAQAITHEDGAAQRGLAERVSLGELAAVARAISVVEQGGEAADTLLGDLAQAHKASRSWVIGVTGAPGSGKSTLVARLAEVYASSGRTVAILAVDPSSQLSGGALLGDRVRMDGVAGNQSVFIRSMAARGALGGLGRACFDALTILKAAGEDVIIIETVGVGQSEIDIVGTAETVLVISTPHSGDEIQSIKVGLSELADIHVLNKADLPGAKTALTQLKEMAEHGLRRTADWSSPVVATIATSGEGLPELIAAITTQRDYLSASGELGRRARAGALAQVARIAHDLLDEALRAASTTGLLEEVSAGTLPARAAARELISAAVECADNSGQEPDQAAQEQT